jgi:outer membrane lipoprotein SlyB
MKKVTALIGAAALVAGLSGCVSMYGGPTVSNTATNQVMYAKTGTVKSVRYVIVQDESPVGTLLGAVTGAALGSTIGKGKGRTLAAVAGGVAGAYVGEEMVSKANAQELTIHLDNGRTIVVVRKGTNFYPGERVRVLYNGNNVGNVEPL